MPWTCTPGAWARRYIQFTIPDANLDGTKPADLGASMYRLYRARDRRGPQPARHDAGRIRAVKKPAGTRKGIQKKTESPVAATGAKPGEAQGTLVTVTELLTPACASRFASRPKPSEPRRR